VFLAGMQSALKGHGIGRPVGDPLIMSGWFLLEGRRIRWRHVHVHAGDPRRWNGLERAWADLRG